MGVYEDMANDAGYAYGSNENAMMAASLEEDQRRQAAEHTEEQQVEDDRMELNYLEDQCNELREKLGIKSLIPGSTLNGRKVLAVTQRYICPCGSLGSLPGADCPTCRALRDHYVLSNIIITERGETEEE